MLLKNENLRLYHHLNHILHKLSAYYKQYAKQFTPQHFIH